MNTARSLILSAFAAIVGVLAFAAVPALATYAPAAQSSFAFAPGSPGGVAIDQSHKVVYVSNEAGRTVGKFVENGKGEFEEGEFSGPKASTFEVPGASILYQLAVDESAGSTKGDIYASDFTDGKVFRYTEAGVPAGEVSVGSASGVAVNSAGDLFVAGFESGVVLEFAPDGKPMNGGSPVIAGLSDPNAIALNGAGDLYVAEVGGGTVEFVATAPGVFESTPLAVGASVVSLGVSVDRSTNDVFVDYGSSIEEFDEAGAKVGEPFIPGGLGESNAIAVRESTKTVLATNRGAGAVDVFALHPFTASTEPASEATKTTAKLHAKLGLEGGGTIKYHFAYGTEVSYGTVTPEAEVTVTAGSDEAEVTAEVTGLLVGETYHYEVVATDVKPESAEGGDEVLRTLGPPVVVSESSSAIGATGASLEARIDPNSQETTYSFQYATNPALTGATTVPAVPPPPLTGYSAEGELVSVPTGVLVPATTYYYRVLAENTTAAHEQEAGKVESFTTAPEAPETTGAKSVTATTATFEGVLDPKATAKAGWRFAYQPASEPPCTSGVQTALEPEAEVEAKKVTKAVTGLEPSKKYVFCLLATNLAGAQVTPGNEVPFETLALAPELASSSENATGIAPTEATLNAQLNPNNLETSYAVEYSLSETLEGTVETVAGSSPLPAEVFGPQAVAVPLTGLHADTTYFYRFTAQNSKGEKAKPGTVEQFLTALETPAGEEANPIGTSTVTLNGVLAPNATAAGEPAHYEFLYRESATECTGTGSKAVPSPAAQAPGAPKEAVSQSLTVLPDTTYTFCLQERNALNEPTLGAPTSFHTHGAGITEEQATTVEAGEATLQASINPNESNTTYHFEYDTTPYTSSAGHGTSTPDVEIGAGTSAVAAEAKITGLEPGTTYYYRVVAVDTIETFDGPGKTLTTPAAPSGGTSQGCPNEQLRAEQPFGQTLPDCRAYEMVSPVQSDGQDATDAKVQTGPRAAVSGEAIAYTSRGSFGASTGANLENELISRREANGWGTQDVTPLFHPNATEAVSAYPAMVFTPDLSEGLASTSASLTEEQPTPPIGVHYLYRVGFAAAENRYVGETYYPMGASTDLSRVVFGETGEVSEWQDVDGSSRTFPVGVSNNVLREANEPLSASVGDAAQSIANGVGRVKDLWQAVSGNGSRVYFTSPAFDEASGGAARPGTRQLFVRVNVGQLQSPLGGPEANGTGTLTAGSTEVASLVAAAGYNSNSGGEVGAGASELTLAPFVGQFRVGQPLSGSTFEAGTTITKVSVAGNGEVTIGLSNQTVETLSGGAEVSSVGPVPFVVGEKVSGNGVAPGTTVAGTSGGSLTLSQPAAASGTDVELNAGGECLVPKDACTINVSESQRYLHPNPAGPQSARYWGASADGSKVFFTSTAELTEDAYTGAHGEGANLYEYDLQTGGLTDLTGEQTDNTGEGAAVQGVVQISEAGGYVYFVAKGALKGAGGATLHYGNGEAPVEEAEKYNLYVVHEGSAPAFIATLAAVDQGDWLGGTSDPADEAGPEKNSAVVSPGGAYLAFMSERSLTGYDNRQATAGDCETDLENNEHESGACREVFLYDAATGRTACASCDPSGARPVGPAGFSTEPFVSFAGYRPRNLLDDGALFFNSSDALVPHATDGRRNVYEYEHGGVYPISNVTGGHESFFLDSAKGPNGEEGGNVFFATADQLLPQDTGNNVVVYDARAGGGFPVLTSAPACDNESSCKPPPAAPPTIFGAGPSETLSAPGNPAPPPLVPSKPKSTKKTVKCKRGDVKNKKGKCVPKKKKKAKKAKKSAHTNRRTH